MEIKYLKILYVEDVSIHRWFWVLESNGIHPQI